MKPNDVPDKTLRNFGAFGFYLERIWHIIKCIIFFSRQLFWVIPNYCQTSNMRRALVRNKIVDHSDVDGASPAGATYIRGLTVIGAAMGSHLYSRCHLHTCKDGTNVIVCFISDQFSYFRIRLLLPTIYESCQATYVQSHKSRTRSTVATCIAIC